MALKRKQAEVLASKKAMDIDNTTARMSEPNIYYLIIVMLVLYFSKNMQPKKIKTKNPF